VYESFSKNSDRKKGAQVRGRFCSTAPKKDLAGGGVMWKRKKNTLEIQRRANRGVIRMSYRGKEAAKRRWRRIAVVVQIERRACSRGLPTCKL